MRVKNSLASGVAMVALLTASDAYAAAAAASSAAAQASIHDTNPLPDFDSGDMAQDIIVIAGSERGAVISSLQPEQTLDEDDVRAYGVGSLSDLIAQLSAETTSIRGRDSSGRPVVLLNGHRVSGFREIHNIPPEAIQKLEIFPEETALAYGFRADQRVVNVILKEHFQSETIEANLGGPTAGKRLDSSGEASLFRVSGDSRLLLDLSLAHSNSVLESDRGLIQRVGNSSYALGGNIVGLTDGAEIDPALSALAGAPVTIAGVPASAGQSVPGLTDFAAGSVNQTDLGRYRTLSPRTTDFSAGASITRPLSQAVQMTLSARLTAASQQSQQGLATADMLLPAGNPWSPFGNDVRLLSYVGAPGALLRDNSSWSGRLAAGFDGRTAGWTWTLTASHDHDEAKTTTSRAVDLSGVQQRLTDADSGFNPFATNALNGPLLREYSRSRSDHSLVELNTNGRLAELPAGAIAASVKLGLDYQRLNSSTERLDGDSDTRLNRTEGSGQLSVDIPLASRNRDVLQPLGDLSLNANANIDRYSDFGALYGWGAGLTWRPVPALQIIASYTSEKGAPTMQQLGDPLMTTPNVPMFDYVRGEAVEVARLDGGNAGLLADHRQTWKLGGRLKPFSTADIDVQADYVRTRISDPIASFPAATAAVEAAFPDRFVRDTDGRLTMLDNRPVNFARSEHSELRWGINFSQALGSSGQSGAPAAGRGDAAGRTGRGAGEGGQPRGPGGPGGAPSGAPGGGAAAGGGSGGSGGPGGGGMGRGRFGGGPGGGRLRLSLFHSWRFADRILIRDDIPELDMLNGAATASTGGTPRHLLEGRVMAMKNGFGGFLSLNWQSGTRVSTGSAGAPSGNELHFSSLTTVDLRLFVNLGDQQRLVGKNPWLKDTRLSLDFGNLLNDRIDVRDSAGLTPASYQSWYMDPVGRSVRITLRKMFM